MKYCKYLLILILLINYSSRNKLLAQFHEYPFQLSHYNMIRYDSNMLKFPAGSPDFAIFYQKLNRLISEGEGQLNIVHYGGSHVQADVFSGQCRTRFQSFAGGLNAGRGYIFPYRLARTNSPYGYHFRYTGKWQSCRNVQKKIICDLGMGGISATTTDSLSSLTLLLEPENDIDYSFNRIKIYHAVDTTSFSIVIDSNIVSNTIVNSSLGYTEFQFNKYIDSIYIQFVKTDSLQSQFQLFGMNIESDDPGIVYHNLGINGAATKSFLRCNRMVSELKTINPDIVLFGIGINDAYGKNFSQAQFEMRYDSLVERVKQANPDAAIVFMTNNDSYIRRRYLNRNGLKVQQSMYRLAEKHNAAVWDLFEIMGGLNSIVLWQKRYLAKRDRIHFTGTGYILLGDLLFDAVVKNYGDFLEKENDEKTKVEAKLEF